MELAPPPCASTFYLSSEWVVSKDCTSYVEFYNMCNWRLLAVIDMQLFLSYLVVRIHISEKPVYSRPLPTKKIGKGPLPVFVFEGKGGCKVT